MVNDLFKNLFSLPEYLFTKPKNEILVFIHLPKCGGTTVSNIARINYNPWRIFDFKVKGRRGSEGHALSFECEDLPDIRKIKASLEKKQKRIDCVLGHIPYGINRYFQRKCIYFTLVRDPISKVWSQFNHILNNTDHYLYPLLKKHNFNLEKILDSGEVFEFRNDQSRMLLGIGSVTLGEKDIGQTIDHINKNIYYINAIENLNQSLKEIASRFSWKDVTYKKSNVGIYKNLPFCPDKRLAQIIRDHNILDQAIYEYVLDLHAKY